MDRELTLGKSVHHGCIVSGLWLQQPASGEPLGGAGGPSGDGLRGDGAQAVAVTTGIVNVEFGGATDFF